MKNPSNKLPSYKFGTIVQAHSNYFCLPSGHAQAEIKFNLVVVKKENGGEEGSKQFTSNCIVATKALKPEFGTGKNFVQRSKDSNEADAGNTKYNCIQEFLAAT